MQYFHKKRLRKRAEKLIIPKPTKGSSSLTIGQVSQAAAAAVRFSFRKGNVADAFDIVNSVRYAAAAENLRSFGVLPSLDRVKALAVSFPPAVSPRLASHALLHGLIRAQMFDKASQLAEQMMTAGIIVRSRTLETLYSALAQMPISTSRAPPPTVLMLESSDILHLKPTMASNEGTQFALRLLNLARESRQRRTHRMFKALMALCILNGEIIVGSLLFGLFLRDWQARELQRTAENRPDDPMKRETPFPVRTRMREICSYVDSYLTTDRPDAHAQREFKTSLQALANLASYLDQRLIPFENITPLLCSMYKCPRVGDKVWVPDKDGTPRQVEAYPYFHEVLERLIHSLPTQEEKSAPHPSDGSMLPRLDPASCSTLVHYSLRHRRSVSLAEKVLHHMFEERSPHIHPKPVLINIMKQSWDLLEGSTIANKVMAQFKALKTSVDPGLNANNTEQTSTLSDGARELIAIAQSGDNYALGIQIGHLVSTGQPQVVVDALPSLLPGLQISAYPQEQHGIDPEQARRLRKALSQEGLKHAVKLGPVVLTSLLNALEKAGKTGIAEKVWSWAKRAEAQSWIATGHGHVAPWCLPVQAYTVMIKVYANEARKGLVASSNLEHRKLSVVGWGRLKRSRKQETELRERRYRLGRDLALEVYRSMSSMPTTLENMLAGLRRANCRVKLKLKHFEMPRPDARFFNAILDVVGRHPNMTPRSPRTGTRSRAYHVRALRKARAQFLRTGVQRSSPGPDPALEEVAKDIVARGFAVPLLYQRLLIGTLDPATASVGRGTMEKERMPIRLASSNSRQLKALDEVGVVKLPVVPTRSLRGWPAKRGQGKPKDRILHPTAFRPAPAMAHL
ncbi:hypothetical protein CVT26_005921 [Gymnopilus dilepis]|uniref:Uncharacterized protein n=1 Tax=Gymnopilus dilepis TaxID=231916 RepID=A0A409VQ42_9AGAR|nr:hypothetical protein CVT26_005921 [Gymnopilus dilepis]